MLNSFSRRDIDIKSCALDLESVVACSRSGFIYSFLSFMYVQYSSNFESYNVISHIAYVKGLMHIRPESQKYNFARKCLENFAIFKTSSSHKGYCSATNDGEGGR